MVIAAVLMLGCTAANVGLAFGLAGGSGGAGPSPEVEAAQRKDAQAHQMVRIARAYARSGDCVTVERIGDRLGRLDPAAYAALFLGDDVILKVCFPAYLEPPDQPATAGPAPVRAR
jgi:hypothetical protein